MYIAPPAPPYQFLQVWQPVGILGFLAVMLNPYLGKEVIRWTWWTWLSFPSTSVGNWCGILRYFEMSQLIWALKECLVHLNKRILMRGLNKDPAHSVRKVCLQRTLEASTSFVSSYGCVRTYRRNSPNLTSCGVAAKVSQPCLL